MTADATTDPDVVIRSRRYLGLLVFAALLGVPVSAAAYGFLTLVRDLQQWIYTDLPAALGHATPPGWWPMVVLALAGVIVGATVRWLPGRGGHVPAEGFHPSGVTPAIDLVGIAIAAVVGLGLGIVLGPEGPLIALGGGLAVLTVRLVKRDAAANAYAIVAAAGSFAAISALLGSPLLGAFLLMEASGLAGATMSLVLVPGLLAAGVGSLIFVGLGKWTGLGPLSLQVPDLPNVGEPTVAQLAWAVGIGLAAAVLGTAIRRGALLLERWSRRAIVLATVLTGLVVGALAWLYRVITGGAVTDVLFSGQDSIGPLLHDGPTIAVGTLITLLVCKAAAYTVSLSTFRGGPIFPAMFLGAAGGLILGHLPGLPPLAGAAIGIGAMSAAMLRLPLTSVLLATLLLLHDGLELMPMVIVAVVCSHVLTARLNPAPVHSG